MLFMLQIKRTIISVLMLFKTVLTSDFACHWALPVDQFIKKHARAISSIFTYTKYVSSAYDFPISPRMFTVKSSRIDFNIPRKVLQYVQTCYKSPFSCSQPDDSKFVFFCHLKCLKKAN